MKRYTNWIAVISILFSFCQFSFGQQDPTTSPTVVLVGGSTEPGILPQIIPPSPEAASLGKYAEWPVNIATGLPNINIPIYNLSKGAINVPIELSYHASGIKMDEMANWTGLGWTLNAGGAISRTVRGRPDDLGSGGFLDYTYNRTFESMTPLE